LIRYFPLAHQGKSNGLNFAINKAKGEIIAFTDDDCIIEKTWVGEISEVFIRHPAVTGTLGTVLPFRPNQHPGRICPAVFLQKKEHIVRHPRYHAQHLGYGNNMAFRRSIFSRVGWFNTWFGPGAIGMAAEDAEFLLRILMRGYPILLNPRMKVYHNRWLTTEEYWRQSLQYVCGEVACYSSLGFSGGQFAFGIVRANIWDSFVKMKQATRSVLFYRKSPVTFTHAAQELSYRVRGLIIGSASSLRDIVHARLRGRRPGTPH
jgi:glycosyltransferase involved in cell wall biosynthesis